MSEANNSTIKIDLSLLPTIPRMKLVDLITDYLRKTSNDIKDSVEELNEGSTKQEMLGWIKAMQDMAHEIQVVYNNNR
jgi:hypothetical protein